MSEIKITTQQAEAISLRNEGEMIKGPQGDSAYQVALNNGFKGTEEAWLATLVGAQGPQGPVGPQGTPGVKGVDGKDGRQGVDGKPGKDGAPGPQGPQGEVGPRGPAGEPGPKGENGKDGYTPIKGKDYFDGEDGKDYVLTEEDKQEIADNINEENDKRITENEKDIVDIETYLDNLTPKSSAKGELVHITDALPLATFENKVDGNVEQFTTTGKNLFDVSKLPITLNGITISQKPNGDVVLNGTPDITEGFIPLSISPQKTFEDFKTGDYTLSLANKIDGIGVIVPFGDGKLNLTMSDKVSSKTLNVSSFTNGGYGVNVRYDVGTLNDFVINPQLEYNSTATPYEPFTNGASPNPDYPQEIEVIEGNVGVRVIGEQLYNCKDINDYSTYLEIGEEDWITITYDNSSGTAIKYINVWTNSLNLKENTKYNILCEIKNISGSGVFLPISQNTTATQNQGQFVKQYAYNFKDLTNNSVKQIIETTKEDFTNNLYGLRTFVQFNAGESGSITFRISVIEDTTVTANNFVYKTYQEQIVPLDLKGNWVGAINDDIKDYLVTDKKKYWLVKNVGKVILDGSENWISDETNRFYIVKNALIDKGIITQTPSIIYSNRFIYKETAWSGKGTMGISVSGALWCVMTDNFSITSALDFKTWLSNNNVTVYYQLAKPETIYLGELPEPIKTFEGVNNIQLLANLDTEIEVKYALDVKKYYDNKLAEISAQII